MDYKKIFIKQQTRMNLLKLFSFISDEQMIKFQYRVKFGKKLNLDNCISFTEKIQRYKLYYRNPLLHTCVDKIDVKKYIRDKGLSDIVIPTITSANSFDEIDLVTLPNQFIIKTSNGSQTNIICRDKENFDFEKAKVLYDEWMKRDYYIAGREWAYKDLRPRILVEELLNHSNNESEGIEDYKFLCFNGSVEAIVVDVDRETVHKRNIYDVNWQNLEIETDCPKINRKIERPQKLTEMINIAKKLSKDFPFVRVDLYEVNGRVYFGELTFYPWSGYVKFNPIEFDKKLGEKFLI